MHRLRTHPGDCHCRSTEETAAMAMDPGWRALVDERQILLAGREPCRVIAGEFDAPSSSSMRTISPIVLVLSLSRNLAMCPPHSVLCKKQCRISTLFTTGCAWPTNPRQRVPASHDSLPSAVFSSACCSTHWPVAASRFGSLTSHQGEASRRISARCPRRRPSSGCRNSARSSADAQVVRDLHHALDAGIAAIIDDS